MQLFPDKLNSVSNSVDLRFDCLGNLVRYAKNKRDMWLMTF